MNTRRQFLLGLGATTAALGSGALVSLASWRADESHNGHRHLTLDEAKTIHCKRSDDDPYPILDLSQYSTASLGALQQLGEIEFGFAFLGFESLSQQAAKILAGWQGASLHFDRLALLTPELATALEPTTGATHAFDFYALRQLDAATASALVNATRHDQLDLSLPGLSFDVATALALHHDGLFLELRNDPLAVDVAQALATHHGYGLHINANAPFSKEVRRVLSTSPQKRLTTNQRCFPQWNLQVWATEKWWKSPRVRTCPSCMADRLHGPLGCRKQIIRTAHWHPRCFLRPNATTCLRSDNTLGRSVI